MNALQNVHEASNAATPRRPTHRGLAILGSFITALTASLTSAVAHADMPPPPPPVAPTTVAPAPIVVPAPAAVDPLPGTAPIGDGTSSVSVTAAPAHDYWREHQAGYLGGQFYLRSDDDAFILYPMARLQMDTYAYGGPGVSDFQTGNGTGLKDSMFAKRARVEMQGRFMKDWFFMLAGDFAVGSLSATETVTPNAIPTDIFIGYEACKMFAVQVGQFDIPFSNENLWTDKFFDFMERSLTVRSIGAPYNKDTGIMFVGENGDRNKGQYGYAVAVISGDGQNIRNPDNRVDVTGRIFVRPLAGKGGGMEQFHIGLSGRFGERDPAYVRYDAPSLSTPGGYKFFASNYKTTLNGVSTTMHIIPDANQAALGADFFLPLGAFDLKGELVYLSEGRREAIDDGTGASKAGDIQRTGTLSGISYYVQAAYWLFGKPRYNPGNPGIGSLPKKKLEEKWWDNSLQIVGRWEQVALKYNSTDRNTQVVQTPSGLDGDIKVNDFQLAANFWASKHVRLTLEWSVYMFTGTPPKDPGFKTATDKNQAGAPGSGVIDSNGTGKVFGANASTLHEISARIAIAI
ncbi:MAG: porin [Polyangiales bacterium]